MSQIDTTPSIAVFFDYENIALGVRDANYESIDLPLVLTRLLDKGKIIIKKAYCDWERYKAVKRSMHEAGFELIEVPHVSYAGKNSADIRMVVDALDMCYTKAHIDIFVLVSGDSDFSPLVSKLRENNKTVIGVGVKNSSSDLLVENCDEFIYYDDLVREAKKSVPRTRKKKRAEPPAEGGAKKVAKEAGPEVEAKEHDEALELVMATVESLLRDRGDTVWGSMVKQTLKRKRPNFNETFYGYRSFNDLLEDAAARGLLEIRKDEKSGGYVILRATA
jgi:uncharacterized protein (TIGR00288 family)